MNVDMNNTNIYSSICRVNDMFNVLDNMKVEYGDLKTRLENIKNRFFNSYNQSEVITDMQDLIKDLMPYATLVDLYNMIVYIENIDDKTTDESIEIAKKLIDTFKLVGMKCPIDMRLRIGTCLLEVIKEDLIKNYSSTLLEIIKKDALVEELVSESIYKEIEEIKASTYIEDPSKIKRVVAELSRITLLDESLVDERIIISLIMCYKKNAFVNSRRKALSSIRDKLNDAYSNFTNPISTDDLQFLIDIIKEIKSNSNKRIISLLLSCSLFGGALLGGGELLERKAHKELYRTTKEVTLLDDELHDKVSEDYYTSLVNDEGESLTLNVLSDVSNYDGKYYRSIWNYSLKNVIRDSEYEYLTIDTSSEGLENLTSFLKEPIYYDDEPEYKGEIRELVKIKQDLSDHYHEFNKAKYNKSCQRFYILLLVLSCFRFGPLNIVYSIYSSLKNLKANKNNFESEYSKLESKIKELENIITQDEALKKQYYFLLNSGIILTGDNEIEALIKNLRDEEKEIEVKKQYIKERKLEFDKLK